MVIIGDARLSYAEDGCAMVLQNVGTLFQNYIMSYSRSTQYQYSFDFLSTLAEVPDLQSGGVD
jgi:hypothetical protein